MANTLHPTLTLRWHPHVLYLEAVEDRLGPRNATLTGTYRIRTVQEGDKIGCLAVCCLVDWLHVFCHGFLTATPWLGRATSVSYHSRGRGSSSESLVTGMLSI